MDRLRICVVGAGSFSRCFTPLLMVHPDVSEVSLCEVLPDRLSVEAARHGVTRCFASYEEALRSNIDAVAIFTQRWTHAPLALQALAAGKHVYCAVPAATTMDELFEHVEAVHRTGLVYMMGETSFYYGARLLCKERWDQGQFGRFVYGEGEYLHDMSHGFYSAFQNSGGDDWKRTASYPPMLYPTHSVAMILSVTGARMTSVSCLGYVDQHEDGVFREDVSLWQNKFSNESALFETSDGGIVRINEFRRVGQSGGRNVRMSFYGTDASFEEQSNGAIWCARTEPPVSVEDEIRTRYLPMHSGRLADDVHPALREDFESRFSAVQQKYRSQLPDAYKDMPNGHQGSHQFLMADFVRAVQKGVRPTVSVWDAARFNAPGIVAHQSALQRGQRLAIPDFGNG